MKKITLLAVVALATTFVSCKKNYVCTCTASSNGSSYSYSEAYVDKMKKSDAESKCKSNETNGVTCSIN